MLNAALPYWEAEAEIAKRFFASKPSREDHIFWLKAQVWKELNPVDGYFNGIHKELHTLAELFPRVDKDVDRHHFSFLMQQMLEEFNHYVMFADILESLLGGAIATSGPVQLPEEKRLATLRKEYATGGSPIKKAAVLFTEGGGARLFREGAKVRGGELEASIAAAMEVIYNDERNHFREAAKEAACVLKSAGDVDEIKHAIADVSRQRVEMRREMFRNVMSAQEVNAFIASIESAIADGTFKETE
ncbi:MAG TPA: hypothetical protein VNF68_11750 [Candidatus Baltobacteraceae bacterium]|nr:hypothetical protein [Candidatus Baltobacteraceae bacterium]